MENCEIREEKNGFRILHLYTDGAHKILQFYYDASKAVNFLNHKYCSSHDEVLMERCVALWTIKNKSL